MLERRGMKGTRDAWDAWNAWWAESIHCRKAVIGTEIMFPETENIAKHSTTEHTLNRFKKNKGIFMYLMGSQWLNQQQY